MKVLCYITIPVMKYKVTHNYTQKLRFPVHINTIERDYYTITQIGIVISCGCRWDGASGAIDTPAFMRASLLHDLYWREIRRGALPNTRKVRRWVDKLLYKTCREDGMSWSRANYVYYLTRLFHLTIGKHQRK